MVGASRSNAFFLIGVSGDRLIVGAPFGTHATIKISPSCSRAPGLFWYAVRSGRRRRLRFDRGDRLTRTIVTNGVPDDCELADNDSGTAVPRGHGIFLVTNGVDQAQFECRSLAVNTLPLHKSSKSTPSAKRGTSFFHQHAEPATYAASKIFRILA